MRYVIPILCLSAALAAPAASAHPIVSSVSPDSVTSAGPQGDLEIGGGCFINDCEEPDYTVTELEILFEFGGTVLSSSTDVETTGSPGNSGQQIFVTWPVSALDGLDGPVKIYVTRTSMDQNTNTRVLTSDAISVDVSFDNSVQPANIPMQIAVRNASNSARIPNAWVIAERSDFPIGASLYLDPTEPGGFIYELLNANVIPYTVSVHASGFLPQTLSNITPLGDGIDHTFFLTPDPTFTSTGAVDVILELSSADVDQGPTHVLARDAEIRDGGVDIGIEPVFAHGFLAFFGVPAGSYVLHVPDTADFTFTDTPFTLGTGQRKQVEVPVQTTPSAKFARFTGIPGQILGTVSATAGSPTPLEGAHVISTQAGSDYSTYSFSIENGVYFVADAEPGLGTIQAFSPDGSIFGPAKEADVPEGDIFGDTIDEDGDLGVPIDASDQDANGLPDSFEAAYLDGQGLTEEEAGIDGDPDNDGLSNLEEATANTNPMNPDSDADTFDDGMEVVLGSNPNNAASKPTIPNPVYVDFGADNMPHGGNLNFPFATLDDAVRHAAPGATIRIKGDVDILAGPIPAGAVSKQLTIEAFNGAVTVGNGVQ